ncbi:adenylyl cyclase CyaB [Natrialba chahannaoensis JCM 10990]|uniref:Adenylyl cyclase CyaB n=1 Tax=Natrialba chahannaoensis JCM 10990 TaxID=1227492 RepID=M0AMH8_9EURY|nr:class IV adenylate cyclase [Natrialba chahannaoensis]ELY99117.1 adenylyl cyclase CyaB [Natrialba chahannaoensis JCM 10990]
MYEVEVKVPAELDRVRLLLESRYGDGDGDGSGNGSRNEDKHGNENGDVDGDTALDATPAGTVVQTDTYYDAPHRSFAETDEALRIRRERRPDSDQNRADGHDGDTRVTYKGPLVDDESKTREEAETAIGNGETFDSILTNLGFEPAATVRKERERYTVVIDTDTTVTANTSPTEFTITLDAVDDVGEYVEVETEVESEIELKSARDGAYTVLESLGLDPDDQLRTSYLGLLLDS